MRNNPLPTPANPSVDVEGVLESAESNHQRLFDIGETFRQDAPKFLLELSNCIRDGKRDDAILAAKKLLDVAILMHTEPLIELTHVSVELCQRTAWPKLRQLVATLETTI